MFIPQTGEGYFVQAMPGRPIRTLDLPYRPAMRPVPCPNELCPRARARRSRNKLRRKDEGSRLTGGSTVQLSRDKPLVRVWRRQRCTLLEMSEDGRSPAPPTVKCRCRLAPAKSDSPDSALMRYRTNCTGGREGGLSTHRLEGSASSPVNFQAEMR